MYMFYMYACNALQQKWRPSMSALPAFTFMADTPIYKRDLRHLRLSKSKIEKKDKNTNGNLVFVAVFLCFMHTK